MKNLILILQRWSDYYIPDLLLLTNSILYNIFLHPVTIRYILYILYKIYNIVSYY